MFKRISNLRTIILAAVIVVLTILLGSMTVQTAGAVDCSVPSTAYPTIQDAVDDTACEVLNIGSSTFYEQIMITRSLTISGMGAGLSTIDGAAGGSVININAATVTLRDLALTNGSAQSGGGIYNEASDLSIVDCKIRANYASYKGGGIFNKQGTLSISGSTIAENEGNGGGLFNEGGTIEIIDSVIRDNESDYHGGGLFNWQYGNVKLTRVSVQDNSCEIDGGGLCNYGNMTIENSSIHDNISTDFSGGGIRNEGSLIINNSTISDNKDDHLDGGGISSCWGSLLLNNVTLSGNSGSAALFECGSNVRIKNSIISGNPGGDCSGTIHSDGYNLVSNTAGCDYRPGAGDILQRAANLGPLTGEPAYNPLHVGPGINTGNPDGCEDHLDQILAYDQRGEPRVGRCDMGAYEFQGEIQQSFLATISNQFCRDFFDDFSDPNSGWPVGEDDFVLAAYNSGEYQVRSKNGDYVYLFGSPSCDRYDFVVETDVRWESDPGYGYGLIFEIMDNFEQYYLFAINTDYQVFWLDYRGPGGWTTLINPIETQIIHPGREQNGLKVTRDGSEIILEINGQVVGSINDSRIGGPGGSGVFTVPYSNRAISDGRFDNFASRALGTSGGSISTGQPSGMALENRPDRATGQVWWP